jgi:cytochrome c556
VSAAAYNQIDKAVSEPHRQALAEKFQALDFALTNKRRISGKPFVAIEDAADAETAIIKDEVGDDYPKFEDWHKKFRAAINASKPTSADELGSQYSEVAQSLSPQAIDIDKLMALIMFILKLIAAFKGL